MPLQVTRCYFEGGYQDTPVYLLEDLGSDHVLPGPAIIIDTNRWGRGLGGFGAPQKSNEEPREPPGPQRGFGVPQGAGWTPRRFWGTPKIQ